MKYTFLGRTGVTVSRLCLGCMSYGDPKWRPWVLAEAAARAKKEQKLVFVLHVSGNFEDPRFT